VCLLKEKITGIYLAAGKSTRFGDNKLYANVHGKCLGSLALESAIDSLLTETIVVTKPHDTLEWIPNHLHQDKVIPVACYESWKGQSHSIKCGLHKANKINSNAVMILLADQPFISSDLINQLIDLYKNKKQYAFIVSTYKNIPQPPILFNESMFPSLNNMTGDMGARYLIQKRKRDGYFLEIKDPSLVYDIDTKEDYQYIDQRC